VKTAAKKKTGTASANVTDGPAILWFRQDLRLQDNPALHTALVRGTAVIPVFVLDEESAASWKIGGAACWWLHHSLASLEASLHQRGSRLVIARGDAAEELSRIVRSAGARAVYWNRRYDPTSLEIDRRVEKLLSGDGIEVRTFNGSLLNEPAAIANKQGRPFQVFTPFWRHCLTLPVDPPLGLSAKPMPRPARWPPSLELNALRLLPRPDWAAQFPAHWRPGEAGARKRLREFVAHPMSDYASGRNMMADDGTSKLSPHLHFGEISPRQVWAEVKRVGAASGVFPPSKGAGVYLSEIGWREFAHHLLFHFPHTPERPLREEFARFDWATDAGGAKLRAWQQGRTGYPIVDAAMRQLWAIGWMHNRARMVVASFLVKHLRLPWQAGAAWFWDTLVDADLANNTLGWQWSAGCGADAAPYFRIFAPVLQGEKFDPAGNYVRRWVPELAQLSAKYIHTPWTAPEAELAAAGVVLGQNYPRPMVDHATARNDALAAFKRLRRETRARP
jgi:deoxyribodipyrimidine photo-lyase